MNNQDNPEKPNKFLLIFFFVIGILIITMLYINLSDKPETNGNEVSYSKFLSDIAEGNVFSVELGSIYNVKTTDNSTYAVVPISNPNLAQTLYDNKVEFYAKPYNNSSNIILQILISVFPILLLVGLMHFSMSKVTNIMKPSNKIDVHAKATVKFADVAGQEEAKEQIQEIVHYLKNADKYEQIGARQPKGALLVGPPGTGKTLLAKAVAGEAGVNFISAQGSDFVEMFVGVGAQRIRNLFQTARRNAPCIIFIDEIDSVGKKRSNINNNSESENTLNALLGEMDGFNSKEGIIVLAATNRPEELDQALLRPGRFDRRVVVNLPDVHGREDTLKIHSKGVNIDEESVDFHKVAVITSGCSGADLENIINEAAWLAVRAGEPKVQQSHLLQAVENVLAGVAKKKQILSAKEKKIVAYHEVGHAMVAAKLKGTMPIQKITIVPRTMGALGFVLQSPEEEKYLKTKEEILNEITTFCAGRACEELIFNCVTTGAANDIEKATKLAQKYISSYGMSTSVGFVNISHNPNKFLETNSSYDCSEQTRAKMDNEIKDIISKCYEEALAILKKEEPAIHKIAKQLIEIETITGEEFMKQLEAA